MSTISHSLQLHEVANGVQILEGWLRSIDELLLKGRTLVSSSRYTRLLGGGGAPAFICIILPFHIYLSLWLTQQIYKCWDVDVEAACYLSNGNLPRCCWFSGRHWWSGSTYEEEISRHHPPMSSQRSRWTRLPWVLLGWFALLPTTCSAPRSWEVVADRQLFKPRFWQNHHFCIVQLGRSVVSFAKWPAYNETCNLWCLH